MQDQTSKLSFLSAWPQTLNHVSDRMPIISEICVHRFNVLGEHRRLRVEADSVVLVQAPPPYPNRWAQCWAILPIWRRISTSITNCSRRPNTYRMRLNCGNRCMRPSETAMVLLAGFARAASDLVHLRFRYEKGATHVHSSIADAVTTGAGVCQDFAHILLAMLRMRGLPGRYVSGYLVPPQAARAGSQSRGSDRRTGLTRVGRGIFLPTFGWFGLDPTLGKDIGLQHVRLAYGRDYGDVAPVRGVYKGHAGQQLSVDVRVRPALDDEGNEHLEETCAAPRSPWMSLTRINSNSSSDPNLSPAILSFRRDYAGIHAPDLDVVFFAWSRRCRHNRLLRRQAVPHENLNAVLWVQSAAEYRASALQTYRAAEASMMRALQDKTWTAAIEQRTTGSGSSSRSHSGPG